VARLSLAQVAELDAVPARELLEVRILRQEHVQAVLDVEPGLDAFLQQIDPGGRKASALGGDADERRVRAVLLGVGDRADDRNAVFGVALLACRVEDRRHVVAPVAQDAAHRLAVVRVGAEALSEDQIARFA
jgi:hypothetical protein